MLNFIRNCQNGCTIVHFHQQCLRILVFCILNRSRCHHSLILAIGICILAIGIVNLICILLVTNYFEQLLICLFSSHIFYLVKYPFKTFAISYWVCSSYYWVVRVLHIFWVQVLYQMCCTNIIFPSLWLVFHFLSYIFWRPKVVNFDKVQFISFLLLQFVLFVY